MQLTISTKAKNVQLYSNQILVAIDTQILKNSHTHIHKIDTEHNTYAEVIRLKKKISKKRTASYMLLAMTHRVLKTN